jgi:hypothetical protein
MPEPSPAAEELHTWKEIADYLRVSVRTAKYWEEQQGMPVLRGPGEKSRVWASRSDLQIWRANRIRLSERSIQSPSQVPPEGTDGESTVSSQSSQERQISFDRAVVMEDATPQSLLEELPTAGGSRFSLSRRKFLPATVAIMAPTITAGLFAIHRSFSRSHPAQAQLVGAHLTIKDGQGRILWTHEFDRPQRVEIKPWQAQVVDLEGTGRPGVVVACNFIKATGNDEPGRGELFYFGPDGDQRWHVAGPPDIRDHDGQPFEQSWNCSHVIVTKDDRRHTVWASFRHGFRWPGLVLRVNFRGESRIHIANAGNTEYLSHFTNHGKEFLVFDGINNEFDRSFIGIVGLDDPPAISPLGDSTHYRFVGGPTGTVRHYLLFPNDELDKARDAPYGLPGAIEAHDGGFMLQVGYMNYCLVYTLTESLEPKFVSPSGSYPLGHRAVEEKGILRHSWADCPELKHPLRLLCFDRETGWHDAQVPWRTATT